MRSSLLLGGAAVLLCTACVDSRSLRIAAGPPALLQLHSPPDCDGPGAPSPGCARHFLASTPVALSGEGPPLFHLPNQGKSAFVTLFVVLLALCVCCLCIAQHAHVFLALVVVKVLMLITCCCGPRLKAWAEYLAAQTANGGDEADEALPLLRPQPTILKSL